MYELEMAAAHAPRWTLDAAGLGPTADTNDDDGAQAWFERGVQWMYAFNHEEAITCFKASAEAAPLAPEPRILISYCHGVNYNNPSCEDAPTSFPSNAEAVRFAEEALALVNDTTSPKVAGLAKAMRTRCALPGPTNESGRMTLNEAFAREMHALQEVVPADADLKCLYAESIMVLKPWDLYDKAGRPREAQGAFPGTAKLQALLTASVQEFPGHVGLLHMFIHCMEMSANPADADGPAQDLVKAAAGSDLAHLLHMPAHIWIQTGQYAQVVEASRRACAANRKIVHARGVALFYSAYRYHDLHMQIYGACMMASRAHAMEAALELRTDAMSDATKAFMADKGMCSALEAFSPMVLHVFIRFGDWEAILREVPASDQSIYRVYNATLSYARGIAFAALGKTVEAENERADFRAAAALVPSEWTLFNNTAKDILAVADCMLDGEIEYRKGNYDQAFASLRQAVELDDGFVYDEPWPWMVPTRHALASLLLEQGHAAEARTVFVEDLSKNKGNIWSLSGLELCAERAPDICPPLDSIQRKTLERCRSEADTSVRAPCLCMLSEAKSSSMAATTKGCCSST
ncbi:Hypothetical Protein FCC1311_049202 [Hondaea fermentalgiana]|uniref:Uncharacterized protein n=1 Tax=Hondaea fermentalgiana TaxID=2315210 RepID=A0A2R5GEF1_9STRA|nr:Hypothetical Protein FCC1311_049202 [Hondaea fermentalgiana]|eukprot:GBG28699.1 Hypothetical Protein FCC1311_049202 [Hondaea fermentalgiana]